MAAMGSERRGLTAVFSFDVPDPSPGIFAMRAGFETTLSPAPEVTGVAPRPTVAPKLTEGFLITVFELRAAKPGAVLSLRRRVAATGVFGVDAVGTLDKGLAGKLEQVFVGSGVVMGVPSGFSACSLKVRRGGKGMADLAGVPDALDREERVPPRTMRQVRGSFETLAVVGIATHAFSDDAPFECFSGSVGPHDPSDPLDAGTAEAPTGLGGRSGASGVGSFLISSATTSNSLRVSSMSFGRPSRGSSLEGVTNTAGREAKRCEEPHGKLRSSREGRTGKASLPGCIEAGGAAESEAATPVSAFPQPRRPCHGEYRDAKLAVEFDILSATNDGVASISDSRAGRTRACGFNHPIPRRLPFCPLGSASESPPALWKAAKDGVGLSRHGPVCVGAGMLSDAELGTALRLPIPGWMADKGAACVASGEKLFEDIGLNTFLGDWGIEVRRLCVRKVSRWRFSK